MSFSQKLIIRNNCKECGNLTSLIHKKDLVDWKALTALSTFIAFILLALLIGVIIK